MRNILLIILATIFSLSISQASPRSNSSKYSGLPSKHSVKGPRSKKTKFVTKKVGVPNERKTKFVTKKTKEPKSKHTNYSTQKTSDPRSKHSKFTEMHTGERGFKMYTDFMLSADLDDKLGKNGPALSLTLSPGADLSKYFFLGLKLGAVYIPHDLVSFPGAIDFRWIFGRRNILTIGQSVGVSYCYQDRKVHAYTDFSFGGRIPIIRDHYIACTLGYAVFPQYTDLRNDDGVKYRGVMSWISPQLRLSYGFGSRKR